MPRKTSLSRRHKRGTGQSISTPHKRKIVASNNVSGRSRTNTIASELAPSDDPKKVASKASDLALAEPNMELSKSTLNVANKKSSLPPGTVVSYVVVLNKILTNSSSKNSTSNISSTVNKVADTTRTNAGGTTSTNDETTTVEVEEEELMLPERLDYENIDAPKFNKRAFDFTDSGQCRSVIASRKAKSRSTQLILNAILNSGSIEQQAVALRSACLHSKTIGVTKAAGLLPITGAREHKLLIEGVKRTFKEVLGSGKRCRVNSDRSTYADILSSSLAGTGATNTKIATVLELNKRTCKRLFRKGEVRFQNAITTDAKWADKVPLKGFSKVTSEIKEALDQWVRNHPNVRPSPITRDTLLVKNPLTGLKERTGKLLLEIPVRELHNDMLLPTIEGGFAGARDEDGKIIISDTTLRNLLPFELRPATETHKQLCGCELCNTAMSLHKTLKAFRSRNLKELRESVIQGVLPRQRLASLRTVQDYSDSVENEDKSMRHFKARDAVTAITCPNVATTEFPPWKCVLGTLGSVVQQYDVFPAPVTPVVRNYPVSGNPALSQSNRTATDRTQSAACGMCSLG